MKKYPLETRKIAEHTVRYTLKLEGDTNSSPLAALVQLFRDLADQPLLLRCGPSLPKDINIKFSGDLWTLIGTAEEQLDMTKMQFNDKDESEPLGGLGVYMGTTT